MAAVAARAVAGLQQAAQTHPRAIVVSHADVIRAALLSLLGMHFDHFLRLTIDVASITELELSGDSVAVLRINDCAHLDTMQSGSPA